MKNELNARVCHPTACNNIAQYLYSYECPNNQNLKPKKGTALKASKEKYLNKQTFSTYDKYLFLISPIFIIYLLH